MTEPGEFIDASTLRFERLLPGPIERIWDYLTKPERFATWLADGELESRAGGRLELRFNVDEVPQRKNGGAVIGGFITRWDPPRCLAYSWTDKSEHAPPGMDATHVTFDLEPRDDKILLTLTHDRLPSSFLALCAAGWHTHLEILSARLRWQTPSTFLLIFEQMLPLYRQRVAENVQESKSRSP